MKFRAKVVPSGNATAVEVPAKAMKALGPQARPPVVIAINDHKWRTRVALMRGQCLVGISAANRTAAGITQGDVVEVDLALDTEPRDVPKPPDLAKALRSAPKAGKAFDGLAFGLKRKHVASIEAAKSPEVRQRRIEKLVLALVAAK